MASYVTTFTGDGSDVTFTAGFPVLRLTDLAVVVNGAWLTLGTDYSVSGPTSAAVATLAVAPANGATVVLRSAVGYTPTDPAAVTTAAPTLNDTDTALWEAIGNTGATGQAYVDAAVAAEAYGRAAADAAIIASGDEPADVGLAPVIATDTVQARTVNARAADEVWIEDFGDAGTGDWTSILLDALAFLGGAAGDGPGGTLKFGRRSYRVDGKITISHTVAAGSPRQANIKLEGQGALSSGQSSPSDGSGGTILDMRYAGDAIGRIDTRGLGCLEITGITFTDQGATASTTPFIQTTNTTLKIHRNAFYVRNPSSPRDVDCIILGGTTTDLDDSATAGFQGYGTVIEANFFQGIRRAVYGRTYCNGVVVQNNWIGHTCGSGLTYGAPFEIGELAAATAAAGNTITGNVIECNGYPYGISLGGDDSSCNFNTVAHNSVYDPGASFAGQVYCGSTATFNTIIAGFGADPGFSPLIEHATSTFKNTLITNEQTIESRFPQGLRTNKIDMGTGQSKIGNVDGSYFTLEANTSATAPYLTIAAKRAAGTLSPVLYLSQLSTGNPGEYLSYQLAASIRATLSTPGELRIQAGDTQYVRIGNASAISAIMIQDNKLGFYGGSPQSKYTVSGSTAGNAALQSLLTALAAIGLITNSTT